MLRRIIPVLAAVCAVSALLPAAHLKAAQEKPSGDQVFGQIDSMVKTLSEITGLAEKHAVPYGRMTKRELRKFLDKRMKKTLKPDEIRADELTLKMFGLVPQTFDLKRSTIDLLTEQAAAFYDYDEKKLFLLDDAASEAESTTLAHELSHALADQHFDLEHYMEDTPSNDDENMAHTAVVEGQASWLMIAYELKRQGQEPAEPTQEMLKSVSDTSEASMTDYPILKGSPLYIQQSLLFPYAEGTMFFDAVYKRMGKAAFAAVFKDPPVDSSQIFHPARYFAHEKPLKPELPKLTPKSEGKEVTEGSVGEFDHKMLLSTYLGAAKANELAPHWRGGQFRIMSKGKKQKPVLEYASAWDSSASAAVYFSAYQKVLRGKWKQLTVLLNEPGTFAGQGDDGYFISRLKGDVVSSVEGLSAKPELP
jgi:hypothetical protein